MTNNRIRRLMKKMKMFRELLADSARRIAEIENSHMLDMPAKERMILRLREEERCLYARLGAMNGLDLPTALPPVKLRLTVPRKVWRITESTEGRFPLPEATLGRRRGKYSRAFWAVCACR
jgi:hypothetical protein